MVKSPGKLLRKVLKPGRRHNNEELTSDGADTADPRSSDGADTADPRSSDGGGGGTVVDDDSPMNNVSPLVADTPPPLPPGRRLSTRIVSGRCISKGPADTDDKNREEGDSSASTSGGLKITDVIAAKTTSDDKDEKDRELTVKNMTMMMGSYKAQQWLLSEGIESPSIQDFVKAFVPVLKQHLPTLERLLLSPLANHAQAMVYNFVYIVTRDVDDGSVDGDGDKNDGKDKGIETFRSFEISKIDYQNIWKKTEPDSPFELLKANPRLKRVRTKDTDEYIPSGLTSYFDEQGFTELYAKPGISGQEVNFAVSYGTRQAGGFSEDQVQFLEDIHLALNSTMSLLIQRAVSHSLLTSYLGDDAGTRVFLGSVDRGDFMRLRSVLWFSDIRGYTALSAATQQSRVIGIINTVVETTESVLEEFGGQILKIMGDGIMAVFVEPDVLRQQDMFYGQAHALESIMDDDNSAIDNASAGRESTSSSSSSMNRQKNYTLCENARRAAAKLQQRLSEIRGERPFGDDLIMPEVGVGLHYGACGYGNIGGSKRRDFTVLGNSVNLAARIEGQCSSFGARVLASESFVKRDRSKAFWKKVGTRTLKGIKDEVSLYEISEDVMVEEEDMTGLIIGRGYESSDDDFALLK